MNNNNTFISKTLKTFLTSLIVSVFIFGSLYFFLSDNSTSEVKSKQVTAPSNTEKSKKLVVDEESSNESETSSSTTTSKTDLAVAKQTETDRQVLGAKTDKLVAQASIPGAGDFTSPFQDQTATTPAATPTTAITGTLPANLIRSGPNNGVYATGVPKTGNESLYIILGIFSTIAGFLVVNGKSFAMKGFERI
jgi:hypothetical protein